MKTFNVDLAIIGAGPAGLAAALEAKKEGIKNVLVLERDRETGGILQQCIHDGFGLQRFQEQLSGPQYAQRFIDMTEDTDVKIMLDTMVLEITQDKVIYACNTKNGMFIIRCSAIILAMGCRERSQHQALIYGSRPAGVMTAGTVQRYINIEGYLPGKEVVILGSGDIGLIMARRMTLEGIKVKGVYELMQNPGGLTRNIVQCLDDYNIPLHLATTVSTIHGKNHVDSVTVVKVDENNNPIVGTEETIPCDLLVLAVGLIPENELSINMGVELDKKTRGPRVNNNFMTNIAGVFAAGNVVAVFDLVDYVSISGEIAARGAAKYLSGEINGTEQHYDVEAGLNVNFIVPQTVVCSKELKDEEQFFFLRVKKPQKKVKVNCISGGKTVFTERHQVVAPPEMIACKVSCGMNNSLKINVEEA